MKNFLLIVTFTLISITSYAEQREIQASNGESIKIEAKDCSRVEYSKISLVSRNEVQAICAPVLCKAKIADLVFTMATKVEIYRYNGDSNTLIETAKNKKETISTVSRLIAEGICKDFQLEDHPIGKWPGKNVLW